MVAELSGQVALVTGGAAGIGRAVSLLLAERGARVVVADAREDSGPDSTVEAIRSRGGLAEFVRLDVSDFEAAAAAVKRIERDHGGLRILVNNAGINADQVVGRMKPEAWRRVLEVNLGGCFNCSRAAARVMLKRRAGRIVNVSSVVARVGRIGQANYAASKAGIEGLTRSLALELAHRGVTVNAVAPGYIDTAMTRSLPAAVREEVVKSVPLGRAGTPEDVAKLVAFLAGPEADYITGQTIQINGGLYFG